MSEKKHIVAAFSLALAITFALVAYLLLELRQSRANERFLDAERHKPMIEKARSNTNNTTATNQIK